MIRTVDIAAEAARLRLAAETRPLKLPARRRIDERHHVVTDDGLSIWYTVQLTPRARILEAIFERTDRRPSNEECRAWLTELMRGRVPMETPGMAHAYTRRFEIVEKRPESERED